MIAIVVAELPSARKSYARNRNRVVNKSGTVRRIARLPEVVTFSGMTRHCWKCGWEWTLSGQPGRSESCPQCRSDLRVCLNCVSYEVRAAHQCRDRRAEPESEKHIGNFCEYFEFVRRVFVPKGEENPREATAREQLKKLLGD
jgi:hypothetical protein